MAEPGFKLVPGPSGRYTSYEGKVKDILIRLLNHPAEDIILSLLNLALREDDRLNSALGKIHGFAVEDNDSDLAKKSGEILHLFEHAADMWEERKKKIFSRPPKEMVEHILGGVELDFIHKERVAEAESRNPLLRKINQIERQYEIEKGKGESKGYDLDHFINDMTASGIKLSNVRTEEGLHASVEYLPDANAGQAETTEVYIQMINDRGLCEFLIETKNLRTIRSLFACFDKAFGQKPNVIYIWLSEPTKISARYSLGEPTYCEIDSEFRDPMTKVVEANYKMNMKIE